MHADTLTAEAGTASTLAFRAVIESVIYRIQNTPLLKYPFPHCYIPDIFPPEFYEKARYYVPEDRYFTPLNATGTVNANSYAERSAFALGDPQAIEKLPITPRIFWHNVQAALSSPRFLEVILDKLCDFFPLHPVLAACPKIKRSLFTPHMRILRDRDHYQIGPHTDSPKRLASLLFYLPAHNGWEQAGTSLYVPRDLSFRCNGGPHYGYEGFERIFTAPYRANSLLFFMKTTQSFHGVEPIRIPDICRDQILYYVQIKPLTQ